MACYSNITIIYESLDKILSCEHNYCHDKADGKFYKYGSVIEGTV